MYLLKPTAIKWLYLLKPTSIMWLYLLSRPGWHHGCRTSKIRQAAISCRGCPARWNGGAFSDQGFRGVFQFCVDISGSRCDIASRHVMSLSFEIYTVITVLLIGWLVKRETALKISKPDWSRDDYFETIQNWLVQRETALKLSKTDWLRERPLWSYLKLVSYTFWSYTFNILSCFMFGAFFYCQTISKVDTRSFQRPGLPS